MAKNSINDIAAIVARKQKISKKDAADMVTAFFNTIADGLRDDRQVKVRGLGTFKVTAVKARESVNVNTGERVVIESHDKVSFVPDQSMKDLVNKPFADFTTVVVNDGVNFDSVDAAAAAEERKITASEAEAEESEPDVDEDTEEVDTQESEEQSEDEPEAETTEEETVKVAEGAVVTNGTDVEPVVTNEPEEEPVVINEPKEESVEAEEPEENNEDSQNETNSEEEVIKAEIPSDKSIPDENLGSSEEQIESSLVSKTVEGSPINSTKTESERTNEESASDEETDDEENVSREYFDEQMASCRHRCNRNLVLSLVLLVVGLIAGFFIGRYVNFSQPVAKNNTAIDSTTVAKVDENKEDSVATPVNKNTTSTKTSAAADTSKVEPKAEEAAKEETTKTTEPEEGDVDPDIKKLNSDRRLRFGAYEIVGVDKVVRLKKGQTMQSYSNKTLGKDMVVYFQVLNGVNDKKEGETLKVPKIRLKKQYRK